MNTWAFAPWPGGTFPRLLEIIRSFFFSRRRRHTISKRDWSSDVCSSDLQDPESDLSKNAETFETARAVLLRGGTIAVFPEGGSHSDPKLRPLKTGTARIALGAAAALPPGLVIQIVPVGLYYRAKQTFRSVALLHFGNPFPVERIPLAAGAGPPAEPVRELTARLEEALRALTLEAEEVNVHTLVARAQHVFTAVDDTAERLPS